MLLNISVEEEIPLKNFFFDTRAVSSISSSFYVLGNNVDATMVQKSITTGYLELSGSSNINNRISWSYGNGESNKPRSISCNYYIRFM